MNCVGSGSGTFLGVNGRGGGWGEGCRSGPAKDMNKGLIIRESGGEVYNVKPLRAHSCP